jgi:hypothetical protein
MELIKAIRESLVLGFAIPYIEAKEDKFPSFFEMAAIARPRPGSLIVFPSLIVLFRVPID